MQSRARNRQICMLSSVSDWLCHSTGSGKDGEGRAFGRANGTLHSYKSSHDAILSHVGSGRRQSEGLGWAISASRPRRERGRRAVCVYIVRCPGWFFCLLRSTTQWPQTKSSDQRSQTDQPGTQESTGHLVYQQKWADASNHAAEPGLVPPKEGASEPPSSTDRSPKEPHSGRSPAPGRAEAAET